MDIKNCLNFPDYTINTLGEVFNKHGLKLKIQYRPNGYGYIILRRDKTPYSLDNKLIRSYESTMEVERLTGVKSHYVVRCCLGGRPTAKGYKWSYERIGE